MVEGSALLKSIVWGFRAMGMWQWLDRPAASSIGVL